MLTCIFLVFYQHYNAAAPVVDIVTPLLSDEMDLCIFFFLSKIEDKTPDGSLITLLPQKWYLYFVPNSKSTYTLRCNLHLLLWNSNAHKMRVTS